MLPLSAAAALCCVPLVTAGPAVLALNGVLVRLADGRGESGRLAMFWSVFRARFRRGLVLEGVAGLYLLTLMFSLALADHLEQGAGLVRTAVFLSASLAAMVSVYWVILLCDSDIPVFTALWNAVCLAMACLPRSLLSAAAVWGMTLLFILLYPISVLIYTLFLLAAAAAVPAAIVWPAVDTLILSQTRPERRDKGV